MLDLSLRLSPNTLLEVGLLCFVVGVLVHLYHQYEAHGLTHVNLRSLLPFILGAASVGYWGILERHLILAGLMGGLIVLSVIAMQLKVRDHRKNKRRHTSWIG